MICRGMMINRKQGRQIPLSHSRIIYLCASVCIGVPYTEAEEGASTTTKNDCCQGYNSHQNLIDSFFADYLVFALESDSR